MDLYGKKPRSDSGKYFEPNLGQLPIIWQHCTALAPDIIPRDKLGDHLAKWELNDADSQELAFRLMKWLESGNCEVSKETIEQAPAQMISIICPDCVEIEQILAPDPVKHFLAIKSFNFKFPGVDVVSGPDIFVPSSYNSQRRCECETCRDTGVIHYRVKARTCDIKAVQPFIEFLSDCGGFGSGLDF